MEKDNSSTNKQVVADYWDSHTDAAFVGEAYWLAHPHVCRRFHRKSVNGKENLNWVDYCSERFLRGVKNRPVKRLLNIGCGDGELDRHLARLKAAEMIDAIDISPKRIEIARGLAESEDVSHQINYHVCDAESSKFPHSRYDAIFFDSSLHHFNDLDLMLKKCKDSLSSRGVLIANEYIGPNRFSFSDREKDAMRAVFQLIPEQYRVVATGQDRGVVQQEMTFPDPIEVERVDPSEAIRSEDIEGAIRQYFDVEEFNVQGGTLLQFTLQGIIGNFDPNDAKAQRVLDMLFGIEDSLVETGDLNPHFALIVARPKSLLNTATGLLRQKSAAN